MGGSYEVIAGHEGSCVVLHVPHAARLIPRWVRERIELDDEALRSELDAMTDVGTDLVAEAAVSAADVRPWRFLNRLSRLVVDPERFTDPAQEELTGIGMGAVYTATHDLARLRAEDDEHRSELISAYFEPYAEALADLVDDRLRVHGRALVIDMHSYPRDVLPYERHQSAARPRVCLGSDRTHTPEELRAAAGEAFAAWGPVWDEPFAGTYVPTRHHQRDERVRSVMVEIRRDGLASADGTLDPVAADGLGAAIARLAAWVG